MISEKYFISLTTFYLKQTFENGKTFSIIFFTSKQMDY